MTTASATAPSGIGEFTRLVSVTAVCAMTEVVCYADAEHIYAAIMTGNTVQFGWAIATGDWLKAAPIAIAIGSFFVGCLIVGVFRDYLKKLTRVYFAMAVFLVAASAIRLNPALRVPVELPVLAFALALQGEAFAGFAGVSLQTIVVTNNLVKFAKAIAGRYINPSKDLAKVPSRSEVLVHGTSWLSYVVSAGFGGLLTYYSDFPLLLPIVILCTLAVAQGRNGAG